MDDLNGARKHIDLQGLPKWQQYLIGLLVIAVVVALALLAARNNPMPWWAQAHPLITLGLAMLAAAISAILRRILKQSYDSGLRRGGGQP